MTAVRCQTGGLQRNPKCLCSPNHPADVSHPCEHPSCQMFSVLSASLVSGGRLPVLARQLSRHQDCKSTLLRLWQKHLPSILLQCTVSFFTCANHYRTVCSTVRLYWDLFLAVAIVVPLVTKVLGEVHILLCEVPHWSLSKLFLIFSDKRDQKYHCV